MKNKKITIQNKITNHIMHKGGKIQGEKLLLRSVKELNKFSTKQVKKLFQLSITQSSPVFKLHTSIKKKKKKKKSKVRETPSFIPNSQNRTSLAIKHILFSTNKQTINKFSQKLKKELVEILTQKNQLNNNKIDIQKRIILQKKYLRYYRWK
jgi:ribosomal protein S7